MFYNKLETISKYMKKEGNCSHKPVSTNKVTEKFHILHTDFHSLLVELRSFLHCTVLVRLSLNCHDKA